MRPALASLPRGPSRWLVGLGTWLSLVACSEGSAPTTPPEDEPENPLPPPPEAVTYPESLLCPESAGADARCGTPYVQANALPQEALAARIVNEPRIARPVPGGEDELNALLPERFFALQDEARNRAQAVQEAAQKRDDAALAESFGRLTETCVSCHSVYTSHRK
ncbi:cytochrome c [Myxococcus sp. RHSTA-1-4]|uniref:cytochrome c n=1 Tax=Myxococcus sp. RHSTA-1-4 TaxID=2874601 RepID=UPI001CC02015|nr:cytochrome c [Myxococcus sp. RHSTA-1-4]MBZ4415367.1 cytochrome c [Myxococcus sp. RHSTA-1-4]